VSETLLQAPARSLADALGLPLASYRPEHVRDCAMRIMRRHELRDVGSLIGLIDSDPDVRIRLRRSIAVSTTGLFRDPSQLRWLDASVIPGLVAAHRHLRTWSAGCAGGEEAFTLAMMLEWNGALESCEVVGSDILEESLADAEGGVSGGARIPPSLRQRVQWDLRDLISAGPPGQFELVLCRNLLSFLTPAAADSVARTLAGSLTRGGVLLVAREERVENCEALGLTEMSPSAYRRI
jgi:chemotaxis protein methyltransferase CheR